MKIPFVSILVLLLLIGACSKEKSKRWVLIDLKINDKFLGIKEEVILEIGYSYEYQENKYQAPITKTNKFPIGRTKDGLFCEEIEITKAFSKKKLFLYLTPTRKSFSIYPFTFSTKSIPIYAEGKNELEIDISQIYYLTSPKFINENCYDNSDTMWFTMAYNEDFEFHYPNDPFKTYHMYGCANAIFFHTEIVFFLENIYFKVISKKNNILDTNIHHFELMPNVLNELEIKY